MTAPDQPNSADQAAGRSADEDARADLRLRAGETEDYVGVPIADEELAQVWEGDPAGAEPGESGGRTAAGPEA